MILPMLINHFAVDCNPNSHHFFGLEPWYQYLQMADDGYGHCAPVGFNPLGTNSSFILIGLAIIDDLIRVAALVAFGFIIYGGITYSTSQGSADSVGRAKSTIVNALIGLVIALLAVGIINTIGTKLGAT